jgi:hypothetical protein
MVNFKDPGKVEGPIKVGFNRFKEKEDASRPGNMTIGTNGLARFSRWIPGIR